MHSAAFSESSEPALPLPAEAGGAWLALERQGIVLLKRWDEMTGRVDTMPFF